MKVHRAKLGHMCQGALILGGVVLSVQLAFASPKESLRQLYQTGECPSCDLRGVDLNGAIMWRTNLAADESHGGRPGRRRYERRAVRHGRLG